MRYTERKKFYNFSIVFIFIFFSINIENRLTQRQLSTYGAILVSWVIFPRKTNFKKLLCMSTFSSSSALARKNQQFHSNGA